MSCSQMYKWSSVLLSMFFLCSAFAETAYVLVVDESGVPIPGATVSAYWFEGRLFSGKIRSASGNFSCNGKGVAAIRLNGKVMVTLKSAGKDGYVFEGYLNSDYDILSGTRDTKSNPRRMVLRKPEPASFLLEVPYREPRYIESGALEFAVDLFKPLQGHIKTREYDDFLVSARYNKEIQRWETVFWTTNANCGLIATTDRRFTAPSTGYVARVEVSQDTITQKSFTLYLKTRDPPVYVMIPFEINDLRVSSPPLIHWDFTFTSARINPYGGRELERDGRTDGFYSELREDTLHALLAERKYPLRPDMAARRRNCDQRNALNDEIRNARKVNAELRQKISETEARMKGKPKDKVDRATEAYRKQLSESGKTVRRCSLEIRRLEKEAHTLNLPDESRKDKEDK
ncbi:MAG: carboxypeptidase regulatory-like domain-containing protein [Kiritimatiellae bacterium]|nr:carboxypeptidase regulatory-like domain-containing protein [Kiritimatiellia bacterium]